MIRILLTMLVLTQLTSCNQSSPDTESVQQPPPTSRTDAEKKHIAKIIAERADAARKLDHKRFVSAVELAQVAQPPSATKCVANRDALLGDAWGNSLKILILGRTEVIFDASGYSREFSPPGLAETTLTELYEDVEGELETPYRGGIDPILTRLTRKPERRFDLFLVVHEMVAPQRKGDESFAAGRVVGRLLVWDNNDGGNFVCSALLGSDGSARVTVKGGLATGKPSAVAVDAALFGDLVQQAVLEAIPRLVAQSP